METYQFLFQESTKQIDISESSVIIIKTTRVSAQCVYSIINIYLRINFELFYTF